MENAIYSCQDRIGQLCVPDAVTVVGTGGFGAWAAFYSALAGVKKLVLFNPTGKSKTHNCSADVNGREIAIGPFKNDQLGMKKVEALVQIIGEHRPKAKIVPYIKYFDPEKDGDLLEGVVFNGVSNKSVHGKIWKCCSDRKLRCFSGFYNSESFGTLDSFNPAFKIVPDLPVWVGTAAMSAALSVHSAFVSPLRYFGDGAKLNMDEDEINDALSSDADQ